MHENFTRLTPTFSSIYNVLDYALSNLTFPKEMYTFCRVKIIEHTIRCKNTNAYRRQYEFIHLSETYQMQYNILHTWSVKGNVIVI
jgi:hypothetical protein